MIMIVPALLYVLYIFVVAGVSSLLFKGKRCCIVVIAFFCVFPAVDCLLGEAVYFFYGGLYFEDSVSGVNVKSDVLAFDGNPNRGGGCSIYSKDVVNMFFDRRDKYYAQVEVKNKQGIVMVYDLGNKRTVRAERFSGRYIVVVKEHKFLNLLFREKLLVDSREHLELAKYRYIARFTVGVPFFSSVWQDYFLVESDCSKKFCQFDRLVISPTNYVKSLN